MQKALRGLQPVAAQLVARRWLERRIQRPRQGRPSSKCRVHELRVLCMQSKRRDAAAAALGESGHTLSRMGVTAIGVQSARCRTSDHAPRTLLH